MLLVRVHCLHNSDYQVSSRAVNKVECKMTPFCHTYNVYIWITVQLMFEKKIREEEIGFKSRKKFPDLN